MAYALIDRSPGYLQYFGTELIDLLQIQTSLGHQSQMLSPRNAASDPPSM